MGKQGAAAMAKKACGSQHLQNQPLSPSKALIDEYDQGLAM
jgi:hypothetical protein